jgi:hypothetical protein
MPSQSVLVPVTGVLGDWRVHVVRGPHVLLFLVENTVVWDNAAAAAVCSVGHCSIHYRQRMGWPQDVLPVPGCLCLLNIPMVQTMDDMSKKETLPNHSLAFSD